MQLVQEDARSLLSSLDAGRSMRGTINDNLSAIVPCHRFFALDDWSASLVLWFLT